MGRTVKKNIDVGDLEYAVEHLIRLAYSPVRAGKVEEKHSIVVDREDILKIALETEKLIELAIINEVGPDFVKRVDQCCRSIEGVIKKTLNRDGLQKMRLAIRQKRHNSPPGSIPAKYNAVLSQMNDE